MMINCKSDSQCSESVPQEVKISDTKNETLVTMKNLQPADKNSLPLKAAKFKDALDLAKKCVGEKTWFYNGLKPDNLAPDDKKKEENLTIISPCKILFHFLVYYYYLPNTVHLLLTICTTIHLFKLY